MKVSYLAPHHGDRMPFNIAVGVLLLRSKPAEHRWATSLTAIKESI